MKKYLLILLAFCYGALASIAQIIERPSPPTLVVDVAGALTDAENKQLEQKLVNYNDSTSTQILVVFIPSLNGMDIMDYAQKIGEGWGVGQKGKDNGIVVLSSLGDRKMWIHTGRGVGDKITDGFASDVVRNIMRPAFRNKQYFIGVDKATTAIMQQLNGTYKADKKSNEGIPTVLIIFLVILAVIILSAIFGKKGGGMGGRGGGWGGPIFWGTMGGMGGGGSSWGGGGSSGGGFGGFGGGSFGGGGAGGDW